MVRGLQATSGGSGLAGGTATCCRISGSSGGFDGKYAQALERVTDLDAAADRRVGYYALRDHRCLGAVTPVALDDCLSAVILLSTVTDVSRVDALQQRAVAAADDVESQSTDGEAAVRGLVTAHDDRLDPV